jgi:hypothetical protein
MFIRVVSIPGIFLSILFTAFSCKEKTGAQKRSVQDTCAGVSHTSFSMEVQRDTSRTDFLQLVDFIESEGELESRCPQANPQLMVSEGLGLRKIICIAKDGSYRMETWDIAGIFSLACTLQLKEHLEGKNGMTYGIGIQQLNFSNKDEMEKTFAKIIEIGWDDPIVKVNRSEIVKGEKRIYIISRSSSIPDTLQRKYTAIIQKEWAINH